MMGSVRARMRHNLENLLIFAAYPTIPAPAEEGVIPYPVTGRRPHVLAISRKREMVARRAG